jgi:hypothetical protein
LAVLELCELWLRAGRLKEPARPESLLVRNRTGTPKW